MYELIVLWSTGEKDVFEYETKEDAAKGADNMRMAFGNQIQWTGINRKQRRERTPYRCSFFMPYFMWKTCPTLNFYCVNDKLLV